MGPGAGRGTRGRGWLHTQPRAHRHAEGAGGDRHSEALARCHTASAQRSCLRFKARWRDVPLHTDASGGAASCAARACCVASVRRATVAWRHSPHAWRSHTLRLSSTRNSVVWAEIQVGPTSGEGAIGVGGPGRPGVGHLGWVTWVGLREAPPSNSAPVARRHRPNPSSSMNAARRWTHACRTLAAACLRR